MARRRAVGKEPKEDVREYSMISIENIICNNSREIKDFTKIMGSKEWNGTFPSLWLTIKYIQCVI